MFTNHKKKFEKILKKINAVDEASFSLDFFAQTDFFKQQYKQGVSDLDLLPMAFSFCRLVSDKVLGMRHYDVQMIGGAALYKGFVAEISTGEGKTLCATLPAYLGAISGNQVHVVTANSYLAERDYGITKPLFDALGLKSSFIVSETSGEARAVAYKEADVIYTTCSELGFDYLRNNITMTVNGFMPSRRDFAIIDEVDSILIDEAKTPLVITGKAGASLDHAKYFNGVIGKFTAHMVLSEDDDVSGYHLLVNKKLGSVELTSAGYDLLEDILIGDGLISSKKDAYINENLGLIECLLNAAKAKYLFIENVNYVVVDSEAKIINPGTGRVEASRRWGGGLHQAIEAKEGIPIRGESISLGSISIQSYFRKYKKLSGMSGTVISSEEELVDTYGFNCIKIDTHKKLLRNDLHDIIFKTKTEKYAAIVKEIREALSVGRPVLIGTISVDESEVLSKMLIDAQVPHNVLNAKNHEFEASIIAQAGKPGAVTISTNMAGRGTDIILGGNADEVIKQLGIKNDFEIETLKNQYASNKSLVVKAGGLYVIGTERADSRRIDNQLIGRSGRQGDPGTSRFFCSFEDRIFTDFGAFERINRMISVLYQDSDEGFHGALIDKAVAKAQRQAEAIYEGIRKNVMRFESIINSQRDSYFSARTEWLFDDEAAKKMRGLISSVTDKILEEKTSPESYGYESIMELNKVIVDKFMIPGVDLNTKSWLDKTSHAMARDLKIHVLNVFDQWVDKNTKETANSVISPLVLITMDNAWRSHASTLEHLMSGINLRAYSQKDPVLEFSKEAFNIYVAMLESVCFDAVHAMFLCIKDMDSNNMIDVAA